jgi:hypothetical protein
MDHRTYLTIVYRSNVFDVARNYFEKLLSARPFTAICATAFAADRLHVED